MLIYTSLFNKNMFIIKACFKFKSFTFLIEVMSTDILLPSSIYWAKRNLL